MLEARAAGCFSTTFVLKVNGRPIGKFQGRWFSESLDVYLTERRHLEFRKVGWLGGGFELVDSAHGRLLASSGPSGFLASSWDLNLSRGPGQLVRAGWFDTAYELNQANDVWARVDRLGWCERGWRVDGSEALTEQDLLLIGLVYHTIRQRQAHQHHAAPHVPPS